MQVSAGAVGSLTHAAPELLNSRCNTPQSDIYAFGVLMYEIISGKEPFKGLSVTDLIRLKTSTDTADTLVLEAGDDRVYAAFAEVRSYLLVLVAPPPWAAPAGRGGLPGARSPGSRDG